MGSMTRAFYKDIYSSEGLVHMHVRLEKVTLEMNNVFISGITVKEVNIALFEI